MIVAQMKLKAMSRSEEAKKKLDFKAAGRDFETKALKQGDVDIQCAPGMRGDSDGGWCSKYWVLFLFQFLFQFSILTIKLSFLKCCITTHLK